MATPAASYSGKGLIVQLGLKDGAKAIAITAPAHYAELTDGHAITAKKMAPATGSFDFVRLFASNEAALARDQPWLEQRLATGGMLGASWTK